MWKFPVSVLTRNWRKKKKEKRGKKEKERQLIILFTSNDYGGDIANFAKFKGNDKNDAMRLTNSAANDVKKQYMQLQHEYPGIELQFEPMPNPQTAGKKREGFFNYQQQLDN